MTRQLIKNTRQANSSLSLSSLFWFFHSLYNHLKNVFSSQIESHFVKLKKGQHAFTGKNPQCQALDKRTQTVEHTPTTLTGTVPLCWSNTLYMSLWRTMASTISAWRVRSERSCSSSWAASLNCCFSSVTLGNTKKILILAASMHMN